MYSVVMKERITTARTDNWWKLYGEGKTWWKCGTFVHKPSVVSEEDVRKAIKASCAKVSFMRKHPNVFVGGGSVWLTTETPPSELPEEGGES